MEWKQIESLVRNRRSVRTYDGRELSAEDLEKLTSYMADIGNPYGIPVTFTLLDAKKQELKCSVVTGTDLFVGGKVQRVPHAEEAFGYSFEKLVLYAQSLGVGTVWIGGTMDRAAFTRAMGLGEGEMMPCVSPLGYPAEKFSLRENVMRKAIKADHRMPFEKLFFDNSFATPLSEEKTGKLARALEMVRWAPSAVNKQPWRIVVGESAVHFYLKHSKGFVSEASGDMQKIDLGIALCHFALAAGEDGFDLRFAVEEPTLEKSDDTEYIATYRFS